MTPYHLGAGGPCRGAAWILQTLPLCYSTKMTANKYLAIVKLKKKHFTVYRPTPFLMVKVNSVNSSIPPLFSIRSKLHPKHRHRSCRCGRLQWIVGIRLGDIGGGSGRLVGRRRLADFPISDFCWGLFGDPLEKVGFSTYASEKKMERKGQSGIMALQTLI